MYALENIQKIQKCQVFTDFQWKSENLNFLICLQKRTQQLKIRMFL